MRLRPFEPDDAEILATISRRAFENDILYGAPQEGGPPGYDSADWQRETASSATAYFVIEDAYCDKPKTYLFWDMLHPTKVAHALMGRHALGQLP